MSVNDKGIQYLVVNDGGVVGPFINIEHAKEKLKGISSGNRFIAEVYAGKLQSDPHNIGGILQSQSNGFNKYWGDWPDINRLMKLCQSFLSDFSSKRFVGMYLDIPPILQINEFKNSQVIHCIHY